MEGPPLSGPQVWLDLNKKAEPKILQFISNNKERINWLDEYLEECKVKLGVNCKDGPSFVPKVGFYLYLISSTIYFSLFRHLARRPLRRVGGGARSTTPTPPSQQRPTQSLLPERQGPPGGRPELRVTSPVSMSWTQLRWCRGQQPRPEAGEAREEPMTLLCLWRLNRSRSRLPEESQDPS